MKPEQFIRDFGEKKAREVVEGAHSWADVLLVPTGEYCSICIPPDDADEFVSIEDLKRRRNGVIRQSLLLYITSILTRVNSRSQHLIESEQHSHQLVF